MNSQAQNRTKDLPNVIIRMISRNLRDTNASRLKVVSKRFRDLVHAKTHPTILNDNNGYRSNASMFIDPRIYPGIYPGISGIYQVVDGKRIYKRNHINLKERQRAARLLPPNRLPVKRYSYIHRDGQLVYPLRSRLGYFSSKTGKPYSNIRPIPHERKYPFGRNSPPRVGRPPTRR
tara:strand:- start:103 stop:630 length:528 start_codon:yes stop_codon:yes gene_type:complete